MTKPTVFLSYSLRDADLVQRFEIALKRLGFKALNPAREMQPGDVWRQAILSALKQSDVVITLVSTPARFQSSWLLYEAGVAESLGKPVFLLLPNKYSSIDLPAGFAPNQIVEFDPEAPERTAQDIASRLAVV
jgi:nucleoside 2-deoxyribosyltransferase